MKICGSFGDPIALRCGAFDGVAALAGEPDDHGDRRSRVAAVDSGIDLFGPSGGIDYDQLAETVDLVPQPANRQMVSDRSRRDVHFRNCSRACPSPHVISLGHAFLRPSPRFNRFGRAIFRAKTPRTANQAREIAGDREEALLLQASAIPSFFAVGILQPLVRILVEKYLLCESCISIILSFDRRW